MANVSDFTALLVGCCNIPSDVQKNSQRMFPVMAVLIFFLLWVIQGVDVAISNILSTFGNVLFSVI